MFSSIKKKLPSIIVIAIILILWQMLYLNPSFNNAIIPSPTDIFSAFIEALNSGEIIMHAMSSLNKILVGFFIAAIVGIGLGLLFGHYTFLRQTIEPIIELLKPIPPIAWIPIAILLLGLGNTSAYFVVFLGAFFPIFINTNFGAMQLPKKHKNLSKTLEINDYQYFRSILFKFTLPYIFTGLSIGIGMAWMSVIAAELIGAQSGLGYYIQMNRLLLRTDRVVVGMIMIGVLGYALTKIIKISEKFFIPWKREEHVKD